MIFWYFGENQKKMVSKLFFVFLLALSAPPMSPVLRALASPKGLKGKPKGLKGKNPRPSAAVRRILGARQPTKGGGGGRRPPPPLGRFLRDPKLFRLVLKSWIFSFQSFRACQGSQNWAHWGLSKKEYKIPFVRRIICCVRKCKHKLQVLFVPPGGQKSKKQDLQNQACHFFLIACYPILIPDSESM